MSRKTHLPKALARSDKGVELFLKALAQVADISLARRYAGLTSNDLKIVLASRPELNDQMLEAQRKGEEHKLDTALELVNTARSVAMATEDVPGMLAIADRLAPEVFVYPLERERARARAEAGPATAIQINVGMADLATRLQEALKYKPLNEQYSVLEEQSVS